LQHDAVTIVPARHTSDLKRTSEFIFQYIRYFVVPGCTGHLRQSIFPPELCQR